MIRDTLTDLTPKDSMVYLGDTAEHNALPLTSRELLSMAVLALARADIARVAGDFELERYYCRLAQKCDCHSASAPRRAKGTIAP